jgi:hypothetical protein
MAAILRWSAVPMLLKWSAAWAMSPMVVRLVVSRYAAIFSSQASASYAAVVELDGLGEELVAVVAQRVDVDLPALDRPEAPAARLVAKVGVLVGGADEDALLRLVDLERPRP